MDRPAATPPLTDDFDFRVQWQVDAGCPVLDPHAPLPTSADVVVVGAGYTGIATSWELARRGRTVVVCERDRLGAGASTRNGGMVIPELHAPPRELRATHGPLGDRLWADVNAAFDWAEATIAAERVDCAYERSGQLYLGHTPAKVEALRTQAREAQEDGEDVRFVAGDDLAAEIGSTAFAGGLLIARSGQLQPARWHAGLARLALAAGAEVHDRCGVVAVDRQARASGSGSGSGWRVYTTKGRVEAEHLVVATNGVTDPAFPDLRRRVLPVGSYILATEPLPPDLRRAVSPRNRIFVDAKNFLSYWRLTPDGRMAFGGRHSMKEPTLAQARDGLYATMVRIHPQLRGVRAAATWGGSVAITVDRLPHCGRRDGVWYATGCNGSGVALMPWLGTRLAAAVADGEPLPSFAELPHPPIPLFPARRAYLPLLGKLLQAQDEGRLTGLDPTELPGVRARRAAR
jgi:glycine/D-amino acid oxidase-like deaminating enzyme